MLYEVLTVDSSLAVEADKTLESEVDGKTKARKGERRVMNDGMVIWDRPIIRVFDATQFRR